MTAFSNEDRHWMDLALRLGARGQGRCRGNPPVGAVLVRDGVCIGAGYHDWDGIAHAESWALRRAGDRAEGATCFVTLEPCAHEGRTPACAAALRGARVKRVVYAVADPSPHASGSGPALLREGGVRVEAGCREGAATALAEGFLHAARLGRALLVCKAACGPDGRLATRSGDSQWISSALSRRCSRRLRSAYDAVMVGASTVLADDPLLSATAIEEDPDAGPAAVVLDANLRAATPERRVVRRAARGALVLVYARVGVDRGRRAALESCGARVREVPPGPGARGVDLGHVARDLVSQGVLRVLVEGGGRIHTSLLDQRLASRVLLFQAPVLIGGAAAPQLWEGRGVGRLREAPRLREARRFSLAGDTVLEAALDWTIATG